MYVCCKYDAELEGRDHNVGADDRDDVADSSDADNDVGHDDGYIDHMLVMTVSHHYVLDYADAFYHDDILDMRTVA